MKEKKQKHIVFTPKKWTLWESFKTVFRATPVVFTAWILLNIFESIWPTLGILSLGNFTDTAIAVLNGTAPYSDIIDAFIIMALYLSAIYFMNFISRFLNSAVDYGNSVYIGEAFVRKKASLKYRYIENPDTQELITRVCADGAQGITMRASGIVWIGAILMEFISVFGVIASYSVLGTAVGIILLVPAVIIGIKNGTEEYEAFKETTEENRYADVYNAIAGKKDFLEEKVTFGYTDYVLEKWHLRKKRIDRLNLRMKKHTTVRGNILNIFGSVIVVGIMLSLVPTLLSGRMSVGIFVGTANALISVIWIVKRSITGDAQWYMREKKSLKDMTEFVSLEDEPGALDEPADMSGFKIGTIEFGNVTFRYPDTERYILKNCSFVIHGDEHCAFVGVNGAGKTTITKLLTRLYDNYEGEIFINGKNLRDYTYAEVKGIFTVVYQDYVKYAIEYKNSVKLGDVNLDDDSRMLDATAKIGLGGVVEGLHHGVDTPLGKISENGVDLSGGEWQRVAIARSIYSRAPMKILDEPTAALDPIAESGIYSLFREITKGCPAIFITHRLGGAKTADRIFVIDGGAVSESGSHNELIKKGGLYADMYNTQKSWYEESETNG